MRSAASTPMAAELQLGTPRTEYTRPEMLRLLAVPSRRLAAWERAGLTPAKAVYGFYDLLSLRKLRQLSARVPLPRIRAAIEALRRREEIPDPLSQFGLFVVRRRLEASVHGRRMDALSGQLLFCFPASNCAPAVAQLKPPSRQNPAAAEDWFAYAVALEERPENRDLAAAAYLRCLELEPHHASACINLGTLRYHQGRFEEAEDSYRRAVAADPTYALAYFDLGNVLDETGRLPEALEAYRRAVQVAPNYADAHYNLALAYEKAGQRRRAIPHWRQYLRLDRASAWANHARAQLKRALARERLALV